MLDAQDGGFFRCQTDNGRVLDDIDPRYLQTVVPHSNNVKVMIVDGARSGEVSFLSRLCGFLVLTDSTKNHRFLSDG